MGSCGIASGAGVELAQPRKKPVSCLSQTCTPRGVCLSTKKCSLRIMGHNATKRRDCRSAVYTSDDFHPMDDAPHSFAYPIDQAEERIDVLGLGQAMIDFSVTLGDDAALKVMGVEKGARKLINVEERARILQRLDAGSYKVSAGGSLSNTLVALARLGTTRGGGGGLKIAMAGLVGSDPLGSFYMAQMESAGVQIVSAPCESANTGTVVVLTSPDAQRTMLSYLGTAAPVPVDTVLEAAIARTSILVIEGYLWELPGALETINRSVDIARQHGVLVAMTAGDAGVVQRHGTEMWGLLARNKVDMLFTNTSEAAAMVAQKSTNDRYSEVKSEGGERVSSAEAAALALGPYCSLVSVTDGSTGSVLTALGQLHVVPPHWNESAPVDTCGAGDAYAAGLLYSYLFGYDVQTMGRTAARTASAVISRHGGSLSTDGAHSVVKTLPAGANSMVVSFPIGM